MIWRTKKTHSKFAFSFGGYVENFTEIRHWRVIQSTSNNSNQNRFIIDVLDPHTTVILPSVTRTLFKASGKSKKKNRVLQSRILNLFQNKHVFFVFLFQNINVIMEQGHPTRIYRVSQKFVPLLHKSVFQYDWAW